MAGQKRRSATLGPRAVSALIVMMFGLFVGACGPAVAAARTRVVLGVNTADLTVHSGAALDDFAAEAGTMPKIAMYYQDWNEGWKTALLDPRLTGPITARGAVPMITWTPGLDATAGRYQLAYRPARIAAGAFDGYVRRAAVEAREYGKPFYINFAREMNGNWNTWGSGVLGNTPHDFIAMWRHVVSIFRAEGATNAKWVWTPNIYGNNSVRPFAPFYPGNKWVDVTGLSGYNWGDSGRTAWKGFDEIFQSSYEALRRLSNKPIIISEVSSAERGGSKARWIQSMRHVLVRDMPRVRAVVWFDDDKPSERNWRINSSSSALNAFRALVRSPLFRGGVNLPAIQPPIAGAPPEL